MTRRTLSSGSEFQEKNGYSHAVVDGDYVFVSGTTGYDYTNMTISDDVLEQADQCFRNIENVLLQAGNSLDRVVRVHYIILCRDDFEPRWPVFKNTSTLPGPPPP